MSFQAYIENIRARTGKSPADFRALARQRGLAGPQVKAAQVVAWLKQDFGLGHGHAMAIWAVFKKNGWVEAAPPRSGPASKRKRARG
jgi:hypothetical protein